MPKEQKIDIITQTKVHTKNTETITDTFVIKMLRDTFVPETKDIRKFYVHMYIKFTNLIM